MVWRIFRCSKVGSAAISRVSSTAPAGGGRTDQSHHGALVELARPVGHDLVDLGAPLEPRRGRAVARITDQILATHRLEQAVPVLRTGSPRVDIDVVVRSTALARVDADRRLAASHGSRAYARRRPTVA